MVNFTKNQVGRIVGILMDTVEHLSFLWQEEALDGDQTEWIGKELRRRLDFVNGNK